MFLTGPSVIRLRRFCPAWQRTPAYCTATAFAATRSATNSLASLSRRESVTTNSPATRASPMRFPHSRWNEVREDALSACGYDVLTQSALAGVDLFAKQKRKSLFVHFQGHPEYSSRTLMKEYRRDIKRFLRQERETYPTMPHGYFDAAATKLLTEFQETALARPARRADGVFPGKNGCRGIAEHLASLGCLRVSQLVALCPVEEGRDIAVRGDGGVFSATSAKTFRGVIVHRSSIHALTTK